MAGVIGDLDMGEFNIFRNADIIRGLPRNLKTRVDVWEVPGLDGYGAQTLGLGDAEFELIVIFYATLDTAIFDGFDNVNDDANWYIDGLDQMQGTMVGVLDDWGNRYPPEGKQMNILLEHVDVQKKACIKDGEPAVRIQSHMKMRTASTEKDLNDDGDDGGDDS